MRDILPTLQIMKLKVSANPTGGSFTVPARIDDGIGLGSSAATQAMTTVPDLSPAAIIGAPAIYPF